MHSLDIRRLAVTIAAAAIIGAVASLCSTLPSTAAGQASYCGGTTCTSHTWLWVPAMRRGSR